MNINYKETLKGYDFGPIFMIEGKDGTSLAKGVNELNSEDFKYMFTNPDLNSGILFDWTAWDDCAVGSIETNLGKCIEDTNDKELLDFYIDYLEEFSKEFMWYIVKNSQLIQDNNFNNRVLLFINSDLVEDFITERLGI